MDTITSTITSSKGQNDMKHTWKKIMQVTNVNKRFATFATTIKHKNFRELWWIPWLFAKKLEDRVFTSHEKVRENAIIQNEKP